MINTITRDAFSTCISSSKSQVRNSLLKVDNRMIDDFGPSSDLSLTKPCSNFIDPCELIKNFFNSTILIDCRTYKDYNTTHIKNSVHVNCGNQLIKKKLENKKISVVDLISCKETKKKFLTESNLQQIKDAFSNSKKINEIIVIYDEKTSDLDELKDNPLRIVQDNIRQHGIKNECKILKGGFKYFFEKYPHFCDISTNEKSVKDSNIKQNDQTKEEIENCKMTEITPFLLLGNESDAKDLNKLEKLGIFHILNVTRNIPFEEQNEKAKKFTFKRISVNDSMNDSLLEYFDEAFSFIEEAKKQNSKVLVHCQAGISRSPTIVIAYLMKTQNLKMFEAYQKIKSIRQIIGPNIVFMNQLLKFEKNLFVKSNENNEKNENNL